MQNLPVAIAHGVIAQIIQTYQTGLPKIRQTHSSLDPVASDQLNVHKSW